MNVNELQSLRKASKRMDLSTSHHESNAQLAPGGYTPSPEKQWFLDNAEQLTVKEVAAHLGLSVATCRSKATRAGIYFKTTEVIS